MKMQANMCARIRVLVALLTAAALGLPAAIAQSTIEAEAKFNQQACYLGDQVTLEIWVENSERVEAPDLAGLPGAGFVFRGTSNESRTMVSIVNGRRREEAVQRLVMRWTVTPTEAGTLIVPPMLVKVDSGQVVRTGEASIRVLEPEPETRDVVRVRPDAGVLYLNQPTRVSVSWVLLADVEYFSFRASKSDPGLSVQSQQRPRQGRDQRIPIDLLGANAYGTLGYDTIDGERVRALQFDLVVTPTEIGRLTLGPLVVSYDVRLDRRSSKRLVAESEPVVFEVRELPTRGRPATFDGLLGTHGIEVRSDRDSVSVGDPILLEATIFGPEPMSAVRDGPDLSKVPGFDRFRLASEGWTFRPGTQAGQRVFTTTVRAAEPGVTEVPAIPLAFFDPGEGEYRVAMSDPIPLTVKSVREVTAADAVVSAAATAISRDPLTATSAGLWALQTGPGVLAAGDPLAGEPWWDPVVIAAVCVPPTVFAVFAVMAVRRRGGVDEASARRRRALGRARRVLAGGDASGAIRGYLADVFGASPAAITGADGDRLMCDAGIDDAGPLIELVAARESAAYGAGDSAQAGVDRQRIERLLRQVDRQLTRRSGAARAPGRGPATDGGTA